MVFKYFDLTLTALNSSIWTQFNCFRYFDLTLTVLNSSIVAQPNGFKYFDLTLTVLYSSFRYTVKLFQVFLFKANSP